MNPIFPFCPEHHIYIVSEPGNAITSILMGAVGAYILAKNFKDKNWRINIFAILIINIGLQSMIMHAHPTTLTTYLDLSSLIIFGIYLAYLIVHKFKARESFGQSKYLFYLTATLIIGASFWLADIYGYYCPGSYLPTGHALWHIAMAISLWNLEKIIFPKNYKLVG